MIINYNDDEEASSPACAASGRYTGFATTRSVVHAALPSAAGADSPPSAFSRIAIHLPLRRGLSLLSCDVWDGGTACDQKLGCVEEVWGTNPGLFRHALAYHLCIVYT